MFDTMTMTKAVGAFCGTLLIYLLVSWAAETIYHGGGGHGDAHDQAYVIDTGDHGETDTAAEEVSFEEVFAAADASKGARTWRQCSACHKLEDGANGTGPHLFGIVGRDIGSVEGYAYSPTLAEMEGAWTPERLNEFLANPRGYAPGTKMSYSGLKDIEARANLIAYLQAGGA